MKFYACYPITSHICKKDLFLNKFSIIFEYHLRQNQNIFYEIIEIIKNDINVKLL